MNTYTLKNTSSAAADLTLATYDAHDAYRRVGCSELPDAQRWIALLRCRGWIDG
ncbi:MAG TPA: hypothetical protein VER33_09195 [Polyangiaceae bacterium]|nr:hypothetical protein [Polyangiaceae bacterium]